MVTTTDAKTAASVGVSQCDFSANYGYHFIKTHSYITVTDYRLGRIKQIIPEHPNNRKSKHVIL